MNNTTSEPIGVLSDEESILTDLSLLQTALREERASRDQNPLRHLSHSLLVFGVLAFIGSTWAMAELAARIRGESDAPVASRAIVQEILRATRACLTYLGNWSPALCIALGSLALMLFLYLFFVADWVAANRRGRPILSRATGAGVLGILLILLPFLDVERVALRGDFALGLGFTSALALFYLYLTRNQQVQDRLAEFSASRTGTALCFVPLSLVLIGTLFSYEALLFVGVLLSGMTAVLVLKQALHVVQSNRRLERLEHEITLAREALRDARRTRAVEERLRRYLTSHSSETIG